MRELYAIIKHNNFNFIKETTKATEFEHQETKQIVYLVPNKTEISIVLDPEFVEDNTFLEKNSKYHNTALTKFPKEKHTGASPIHFGYSFKFETVNELDSFLEMLNKI